MMDRQIKLLFVAFGCEPGRGSEPGVGWGFVDEAARRRPVWVITHSHHRDAIENYLKTRHQHHPIHVSYVRIPGMMWLWKTHFGINLYYYVWQFLAAAVGRKLHRQIGFDIVHHVSFTRYWMQSAGAFIGGNFVFGPVGGGEPWPVSFYSELTFRERLHERYWAAIRRIMEWDPLLYLTLKRTKYGIGSNEHGQRQLQRMGVKNVEVMSAVAPVPELPPLQSGPGEGDVFRFISIGRLPRWRGVHLSIHAFAKAFGPGSANARRDVEYTIIGVGEELENLRHLAHELGVAGRVKFLGDLTYAQGLEHLAGAGALVISVLRDAAGLSHEALSLGVPVICTDLGTPALLTTEACGQIVSLDHGAQHTIDEIARTMAQWVSNLPEYRMLRQNAVVRAREMSRASRGDHMDEIYRRVLGWQPAEEPAPAGACDVKTDNDWNEVSHSTLNKSA